MPTVAGDVRKSSNSFVGESWRLSWRLDSEGGGGSVVA